MVSLVLEIRRGMLQDGFPDITCTVTDAPKRGSFNVVYQADFSDGVSWAVRIPLDRWDASHAHAMRLDMVGIQYIIENTSLPIPRVHAYDCGLDNILQHPYIVMDYVRGTRLVDVWNEPSWWTGDRSKERLLTSIARYMVELSKLEFDKIGCLDRADDGSYHIVPFPSPFPHDPDFTPPPTGFGPFTTTHAYLLALLDARVQGRVRAGGTYGLLRLFLGALPDARFDSAPFTLVPPDFDSQNILVDDQGDVAAFIDWDWVATQPRQLGALTYPAWLTVDWDPLIYDGYKERANHDTEADLHAYREMYASAVDALSGGTLGDVVRNSHVVSTLALAVHSFPSMCHAVTHVGRYVFGCQRLALDAMDGIEHGAWDTLDEREVAQVKGMPGFPSAASFLELMVCTARVRHLRGGAEGSGVNGRRG
ncbi:kinase-like domain-containing protein [Earliella scabrosa]|nr:kinase-like domain-containing protein [Earliella scabrosa]